MTRPREVRDFASKNRPVHFYRMISAVRMCDKPTDEPERSGEGPRRGKRRGTPYTSCLRRNRSDNDMLPIFYTRCKGEWQMGEPQNGGAHRGTVGGRAAIRQAWSTTRKPMVTWQGNIVLTDTARLAGSPLGSKEASPVGSEEPSTSAKEGSG